MKQGLHTDKWGIQRWYQNDELHREDGPAVIYQDGTQYWYQHGKLHNIHGPAIIYANGNHTWYLFNTQLTHPDWLEKRKLIVFHLCLSTILTS